MNFFLYIWPKLTTVGKYQDDMRESFDNGKELGYLQAIETAQQIRFHQCPDVSTEEMVKLSNFLIDNNLEMVYSSRDGGLRVRRLMPRGDHDREMMLRRLKEEELWKRK